MEDKWKAATLAVLIPCALFLLLITLASVAFAFVKRVEMWDVIKRDRVHFLGAAVPLLVGGGLRLWSLNAGEDRGVGRSVKGCGLGESGPLEWHAALGAVVAALVMAVSGVSGRFCGFPVRHTRFLKLSPVLCLVDVLDVLWQICGGFAKAISQRRQAARDVTAPMTIGECVGAVLHGVAERKVGGDVDRATGGDGTNNTPSDDKQRDTSNSRDKKTVLTDTNITTTPPPAPIPASSAESASTTWQFPRPPGLARASILLLWVLPQAIKLFSCSGSGLFVTRLIMICYTASFLVDESLSWALGKSQSQLLLDTASVVKGKKESAVSATLSPRESVDPAPTRIPDSAAVPSLDNFPRLSRSIASSSLVASTTYVGLWTIKNDNTKIFEETFKILMIGSMILVFQSSRGKIDGKSRWILESKHFFNIVVAITSWTVLGSKGPSAEWWMLNVLLLPVLYLGLLVSVFLMAQNDSVWWQYDRVQPGCPPVFTFALVTTLSIMLYYVAYYPADSTCRPSWTRWIQ